MVSGVVPLVEQLIRNPIPLIPELPKDTVFIAQIAIQNRSQRVTKQLAEPDTAGST